MVTVDRVQTGVRIEKRILKVMKGLAEYHDITLGDLIEGVMLHVFEGRAPFGDESMAKIANLKSIYGLELTSIDAHKMGESE